jgi:multidrug efflux pump subunit AcrA (membrane-fusion protein)
MEARESVDQRLREEEPRPITSGPSLGEANEAEGQSTKFQPVARARSESNEKLRQDIAATTQSLSVKRSSAIRWIVSSSRWFATLAVALVAVLSSLVTWDYYVTAPWTRDGRVRVQAASVAPQVSGQITELRVSDNQFVHKGDVLYVIDSFDFNIALRTDTAALQQKAADLQVKERQSARRQHLTTLETTAEEQQTFAGNAIQAKAAFEAARQQVAQAEINLYRTQVRSPVNGYITNLLMRVGDYAHVGLNNVSIVDTDSYWIDGYFEETKMARVCIGDRAEAKLMGYSQPIVGHVASVTRGTSVSNATAGVQGRPTSTRSIRGCAWRNGYRFASLSTRYHRGYRSSPA